MTINLQNLRDIENELETYTLNHAQFSKINAIRKLYHRIEEALDNGLTTQLLCDYLNQKGLEITPNYLYLVLHRIRKERGHSPPSTTTYQPKSRPPDGGHETPIPAPTPTSQPTPPAPDTYDRLMEQYMACDNPVDRYVALGGKREDIEEKNISTQRSMVSQLRTKLRQKYKGIYS